MRKRVCWNIRRTHRDNILDRHAVFPGGVHATVVLVPGAGWQVQVWKEPLVRPSWVGYALTMRAAKKLATEQATS